MRPTVVSLEWDYCYPSVLADRSPGVLGTDLLDPAELGLSAQLTARLEAWRDRQESLSGAWVRDAPPVTEAERNLGEQQQRELLTLAHDVQHELGADVEVLLDGRPLKGRHRAWWPTVSGGRGP
ncbi:hypothetical protein [Blastococcus sp. TF02A-35]|uniref:hypothetical protein n=1 Tax=Blastococcus sp. TF02A-35 TaxID=2559612 RepID=UPI0010748D6B|nr:hypothetical protein [Blastococcus sp. TF02A_35]TFV47783.1 hypothetical protein E4P43_14720 [Blastococcus sp. TF02A_35]